MLATDDKGTTYRAYVEASVRQGRTDRLAELVRPDVPEWIEYLQEWFYELHRTRDVDMNGPKGLTYPMIESWARLTDRAPDPRDVEALFTLDRIYRFPDTGEKASVEANAPMPQRAWPSGSPTEATR